MLACAHREISLHGKCHCGKRHIATRDDATHYTPHKSSSRAANMRHEVPRDGGGKWRHEWRWGVVATAACSQILCIDVRTELRVPVARQLLRQLHLGHPFVLEQAVDHVDILLALLAERCATAPPPGLVEQGNTDMDLQSLVKGRVAKEQSASSGRRPLELEENSRDLALALNGKLGRTRGDRQTD